MAVAKAKAKTPQGSAKRLIEVALAEVGTVEGPKENQTKYGAFTKVNFQPWCGSFVMWCANQAGVKVPNTVYTPAGADAYKKAKAWQDAKDAKPLAGDIVFFDFPSDGVDRISHVGIVVKDNGDGTVTTVEGNTAGAVGDQRNGGMVQKKVRGFKKNSKKIEISIVGFGRPKFVESGAAAPAAVKPEPAAEVAKVTNPKKYPGSTVDPGESGDAVKMIQKALGLTADGHYGPVMKKTVVAYQKANPKLGKADGIIGPKTWAAMMKLIK
jgi:surface antigen